ncbi:MAG: hypothetical protein U0P30_04720 [Vicinamibacterales bacterium]
MPAPITAQPAQLGENGFIHRASAYLALLGDVKAGVAEPFEGEATIQVASPLPFLVAATCSVGSPTRFCTGNADGNWEPAPLARWSAVGGGDERWRGFVGIQHQLDELPSAANLAQSGMAAVVFDIDAVGALGSVSWLLPEK